MTVKELIALLNSLGVDTSGLNADDLQSEVGERIVLKKFNGDGGELVETIVIENGKVLGRDDATT